MSENSPSYSIAVPVFVLADRNISPTSKLLYGVIDSFLRKSGVCYATNTRLAQEVAGCSERTISRSVAELKEAGYIKLDLLPKRKDQQQIRQIRLNLSVCDGQGVDKNGDTPTPILSTPHDNIGEEVIQEVNKKENNKKKKQLSLDEMRPLFVEWIQSVAGPEWTRKAKNDLYGALESFYDPDRTVKKGAPPVRSIEGFKAMGRLLERHTGGNPATMVSLIDIAIANGWVGIKVSNDGQNKVQVQKTSEERQYKCV